jgi:PAS domain S-box-containing protein
MTISDSSKEIIPGLTWSSNLSEYEKDRFFTELAAAVIDSSSDAIITKNLDGTITSWNHSAEQLFGYSAQETIGHPVTMLFPPDHINEEPEIIRRIKNGERLEHYETIRRRKDGTLIPISLTVSPIRNHNGEIIGASKIARNISSQKAYEQRLITQADELEQFAYVASHDLKEPLRKIVLYSEMLFEACKGAAGPEAEGHVEAITSAVTRMQTLINDLLSYSRANRENFKAEMVDLNVVVQDVMDDILLPGENQPQITFDRLPTVQASVFQIYQLFQNLISNAVKFRGDKPAKVHISSKKENGCTIISVQDNGIGIEPRYKDQIFRVFQRLHTGHKYPGTGIGLAICKKVVEQHGGKIWVDSTPGQGAMFSFSLNCPEVEE